jgi:hypothetical protein
MTTWLTRAQLRAKYPVPGSRPGLRNWIKKRGFPAPTYANPNTPLYGDERTAEWFDNLPTNYQDALAAARAA